MLAAMLRQFRADESGAVTTDWVVLTAGIVGLGIVAAATIANSTSNAAESVSGDVTRTVASAVSSDYEYSAVDEAPAGHDMTTAEFLAAYQSVSGRPDGWASSYYSRFSSLSNADLQAKYSRHYSRAASGTSARSADKTAILERMMADRGMSIPTGNSTAQQIRTQYE